MSAFEGRKGGNGTCTGVLQSTEGIGDEGIELSMCMLCVIRALILPYFPFMLSTDN